jgi:hypothetical protein
LFLAPVIRTRASARPCAFSETPQIFVDGAEVLGVSWLVRRTIFRMLQAFSYPAWEQYRSHDRLVDSDISTPYPGAATVELEEFEREAVALRARSLAV